MSEKSMTILQHLEELRKVLIVSLLSMIPTTLVAWFFRDSILWVIIKPLRDQFPDFTLKFFGPTEAFFTFLKLSIATGLILALPIILYQLWKFILPALKQNEKKFLYIIVPMSFLLFISGVTFAYFTVFKIALFFFLGFGGEFADPLLRLSEYLSFTISFLLPFGLVFQLPLVILFLTKFQIVSPQFLAKKRKYALFYIVLTSTLLTPPDIISQLLMSGPMYLLYEVSIWIAYIVGRKKKEKQEVTEEE